MSIASQTTFEVLQSRDAMENTFQSQLGEISGKIEKLVSERRNNPRLGPAIPL
jgi:hypothetical protein